MEGNHYVIDRFEGEYAVCEDPQGQMKDFARVELPKGAREGDVLLKGPDGTFTIDAKETAQRREHARKLFENLLSDD